MKFIGVKVSVDQGQKIPPQHNDTHRKGGDLQEYVESDDVVNEVYPSLEVLVVVEKFVSSISWGWIWSHQAVSEGIASSDRNNEHENDGQQMPKSDEALNVLVFP